MVKCSVCGVEIYFKKNSKGKYVPFNKSDDKNHYENKNCHLMPKSDVPTLTKPDGFWKPRGISYKTVLANKTIGEFTEKNVKKKL